MKGTIVSILSAVAMTFLASGPTYAGAPPPPVPEPTTIMLLGGGLAGLIGVGLVLRNLKKK